MKAADKRGMGTKSPTVSPCFLGHERTPVSEVFCRWDEIHYNRAWHRVAAPMSLIDGVGQSNSPEKELGISMPALICWRELDKHEGK